MVNLKSSGSEIKLFWKFKRKKPHLKNYFKAVSINSLDNVHTLDNFSFTLDNYNNKFKRVLESLRTKDDFNFTNFLINRVMGCSTKVSSHCCFRIAISNNRFQNFLLINFISICSSCLIAVLLTFCWQKAMESILYEKSRSLLLS